MQVHVPPEISEYEGDLQFFFTLMVRKLALNRHKGFGDRETIEALLNNITDEHVELCQALHAESQFAVMLEAVDVANFALLVALKTSRMTRQEFEDGRS